jgi:hypothetical protein
MAVSRKDEQKTEFSYRTFDLLMAASSGHALLCCCIADNTVIVWGF